ncbi:MAG: nitroreductase [Clostridia bacterium]|nr:nitroreductase [Clostridia bacterium]NCC76421.1 nitroreductase [Clostridia bacterium]
MKNFITLAENRYSVRTFKNQPVEQDKLDLVLRAGQVAPTAVNYQPQRILVIRDEDALAKLDQCTRYRFQAPVALLVCFDRSASYKRRYDGKDSGEIDASIVTTHMMLAAAEIGLGTTWVMSFDPAKMVSAFQIPDQFEPIALLVLGYPADDAMPSKSHGQRKAIHETVFYDTY